MSEEKTYDIKIRSYQFSKAIIKFISSLKFDRLYFSIFDQLLRSATSIGANVVEGKARSSRRDFKNFYNIAIKFANETKYGICIIRDTEVAVTNKEQMNELLNEANEISKILATIIINLNKDSA